MRPLAALPLLLLLGCGSNPSGGQLPIDGGSSPEIDPGAAPFRTFASDDGTVRLALRTAPQPPRAGIRLFEWSATGSDRNPSSLGAMEARFSPGAAAARGPFEVADLGNGMRRLELDRGLEAGPWTVSLKWDGGSAALGFEVAP